MLSAFEVARCIKSAEGFLDEVLADARDREAEGKKLLLPRDIIRFEDAKLWFHDAYDSLLANWPREEDEK